MSAQGIVFIHKSVVVTKNQETNMTRANTGLDSGGRGIIYPFLYITIAKMAKYDGGAPLGTPLCSPLKYGVYYELYIIL